MRNGNGNSSTNGNGNGNGQTQRRSGVRKGAGADGAMKAETWPPLPEPVSEAWEVNDRMHYVIDGGVPLKGEVRLSGTKNAATKLMVASMLTEDACTIRNAPAQLGDVSITADVMTALGSEVTWREDGAALCQTRALATTVVPMALGRKNRLAVLTVGALLHRAGRAVIPVPGGDRIGPRPINFNLLGLEKMGARIEDKDGLYTFTTSGLKGATIELPYPSVMATETLIIAATLARGITVIQNAAIEPEILDLVKFLQKMGAIVEQRVDRKIVIEGVDRLHGADHHVLCD
ncbi:MAG: UDP-N-acetylglucosamine 1-carboxyvinyltransferase, partial [Ktedonobacterales bacterium]